MKKPKASAAMFFLTNVGSGTGRCTSKSTNAIFYFFGNALNFKSNIKV